VETPIEMLLNKQLSTQYSYELKDKSGKRIPAQLKDSLTLVFLPSIVKPGASINYQLETTSKKAGTPPVKLQRKHNGILVQISDRPVFFYHTEAAMPPADSPAFYKRSGFIHPLYSPAGQVLSDDFPAGHVHQHAIFSAWTSTRFRKTPVDFWNQHNRTGTVEHSRLIQLNEGPVFSEIVSELNHKSLQHGNVLTERWRLIIYPYKNYFLFDLESLQINTSSDTLFLNPYHYGGMAFRGSREWNRDDKRHFTGAWTILTSEGMKDSAADQTAARWVDAAGWVDKKYAGVAVFNHHTNFRYPQKIRVHPQMPYWCYAPMIDGAFFIAPGKSYQAKFRYFVHNDPAQPATLDHLHKAWISQPEIKAY
jgi:hypothetical protein